jgi:hypothetical protein
MRASSSIRLVVVTALIGLALAEPAARQASRKFFDDDPLWSVADTQDASKVQPWDIDLAVDLAFNLFAKLGDQTPNVRARSINTVDEVPDSSWYTNRAGRRALTVEDVVVGPDTTSGPAAGTWTVTSAKSDGVTPGFTIRDSAGTRWFLKFDPPGHRAMATGTEVAVTKLMWALGYHVPENHVASLRVEQLVIGDGATVTPPGAPERPMRPSDIAALLERADREPDGSYRIVASKGLAGRPLGGFRFYDTRPDDPNDVVPHEHRRELRGYGVFAAWLNHVDAKAINSLDMLVTENGRSFVRHHLIDFGSTLGSGGVAPREAWEGFEYLVQPGDIMPGILSFGRPILPWRTVPLYEASSIGAMPRDNSRFNPDQWKPRVPNQAFIRARADDKFWAATKLAAISDAMIRAAIRAGQFGDPATEQFLGTALIERRQAILRAYLPAINPVTEPAMDASGGLTFRNAAVDAGVAEPPARYRAAWFAFNNGTGDAHPIGEATAAGPMLAGPAGFQALSGSFVRVEIRAESDAQRAWADPVHAYFRRTEQGWILVGFERLSGSGPH